MNLRICGHIIQPYLRDTCPVYQLLLLAHCTKYSVLGLKIGPNWSKMIQNSGNCFYSKSEIICLNYSIEDSTGPGTLGTTPRKFKEECWKFQVFQTLTDSFESIHMSKGSLTVIKSWRDPKITGKVWDSNLWSKSKQNLLNKNVIFKINFQLEHTWAHIWVLA